MQTLNFRRMLKHVAFGLTLTVIVQMMFSIGLTEQKSLNAAAAAASNSHHDTNSFNSNDLKYESPRVSIISQRKNLSLFERINLTFFSF
jgi:hypothetical protein